MVRFVIVAFVFLAWVFYEMSGGADFDPVETRLARVDQPAETGATQVETETAVVETSAPAPENVTRVSLNLTSVGDVVRPEPTLRTKPARQNPAIEGAVAEALSEEPPKIFMPSLVGEEVVITPVEFGDRQIAAVAPSPRAAVNEAERDVRAVTGNRVNVRGGPGTDYSVVDSLQRGDRVEILEDSGTGWVKLRSVDSGTEGWMADFLLGEG